MENTKKKEYPKSKARKEHQRSKVKVHASATHFKSDVRIPCSECGCFHRGMCGELGMCICE